MEVVVAVGRIKWFTSIGDRAPAPLGVDCEGAATLYGRQDGFTLPSSTGPTDPQERAAANRAFWTAAPVPARPGLLARLLRGRTRS
jgi:hypothetical protein